MIGSAWIRYLGVAAVLGWASSAVAQTPRDSAGITIVDNAAPSWRADQAWRLSDSPILTLDGGPTAEDKFGRIVGATRLSDGRVVVADESKLQLRFYDASGRHLLSVAGEGPRVTLPNGYLSGQPNGFEAIARTAGDTIVVQRAHGESILAPGGTFVREVQFGPFAPGDIETPIVLALGHFENGNTVVADYPQGTRGPAGAREWVDSSSIFLTDRNGAVLRRLPRLPIVVYAAGAQGAFPMSLGPQAVYGSAGNTFYWGFPEDFSIRQYNADWQLERIIRRPWTPGSFTTADRDAYVDGWMAAWSQSKGAEREAERQAMRADAYPSSLPAYSALLVSPGGELWLRDPDLTGAPGCWCLAGIPTVPSQWSVFDAEGRWLGQVAMPARFVPFEIGSDYVLGRTRDADGVQRAVMYRIEKSR